METQKNIKNMEVHGCQYCSKPCYGLQCKDCHMKMMAERAGVCIDCSKSFQAMRKDGTMRKRCLDCQDVFASSHLNPCEDCSKPFPAKRKDGTMKKRCFDCQTIFTKANFKKCDKCDNSTRKEYAFCRDCVPKKTFSPARSSASSAKSFTSRKCEFYFS